MSSEIIFCFCPPGTTIRSYSGGGFFQLPSKISVPLQYWQLSGFPSPPTLLPIAFSQDTAAPTQDFHPRVFPPRASLPTAAQ